MEYLQKLYYDNRGKGRVQLRNLVVLTTKA